MTRLHLFKEALNLTKKKLNEHPNYFVLNSVIDQLEYLIRIEEKKEKNFSGLTNMTLGRITAYDIDNLDENLASILHKASAEIPHMQIQYLGK